MTEQEEIKRKEYVVIQLLQNNPYLIKSIGDPSKELQLAAVRKNGLSLQHIKNPSREVQVEAIQEFPAAIEYVENPDREMQLLAIGKVAGAIQFIKNPIEEVQLLVIKKLPSLVEKLENPTKKVCLESFSIIFKSGNYFNKIRSHDPLLVALKEGKKEVFLSLLPQYHEELQTGLYFENILHYLMLYRKEWVLFYIQNFPSLSKEQQDIWNQYRLKTLL